MDRNLERWRTMTPEQRQRAREQIQERRLQRGRDPGPGPDRPGTGERRDDRPAGGVRPGLR